MLQATARQPEDNADMLSGRATRWSHLPAVTKVQFSGNGLVAIPLNGNVTRLPVGVKASRARANGTYSAVRNIGDRRMTKE